jgi:DNA-binding IclR family transcriptional regulator
MPPNNDPRNPPAARTGVDAVDRALALLAAFGEDDDALALAELARRSGMYKSTVLRLIASLARARMIERGADGAYRLGAEIARLGALYRRRADPPALIRPALAALVEATGETASFYVRDGRMRVCLYRHNSPKPVRHHLEEGVRLPLERGAAGRILLAFGGTLGSVYDRIRRVRAYVSLGERDPEVGAAAVPVFDASGRLRGALSVSALLTRFDRKAQRCSLAALAREANELAVRLPPDPADSA